MENEEGIPPGLTPERVGFFTDAVFAIAMTLLVIDIPQPEDGDTYDVSVVGKAAAARHLLSFLYHQISSFSAYVLAFWMLWLVWRQHHVLFDRITKLSHRLVGLHFPLLLLIGFVPYAVSVYEHHTANPVGAAIFTLAVAGLLACRAALQSRADRDGLVKPGVDMARYRVESRTAWGVAAYFALTTLLCWYTPWTTFAWFVAPVAASLSRRLSR